MSLPPTAAIFSPSVARAAASAAKDWSYIDAWLTRKFPNRPSLPAFERNADTLRILLALATANDAADEQRALVARLEKEALKEVEEWERQQQQKETEAEGEADILGPARKAILQGIESALPREGQTALDAMAALAVQRGIAHPTPALLAEDLIALSAQAAALDEAISRVQTLAEHIAREAERTAALAAELKPPEPGAQHNEEEEDGEKTSKESSDTPTSKPLSFTGYHPPTSLALHNLSLQRHIKSLSTRLPELRDKSASSLSPSLAHNNVPVTLQQVREEEAAYRALLEQKQMLDAKLRELAGLPPDEAEAKKGLGQQRRGRP
ncbi:uncharacterized protein CTHT_0048620 [Thermochaetoides thermophila DSM 1495]|uniref:Uncharacterized protein n=1 Tax=Chaetomium thermophilum (strain DSM 1495 / CBS 144.50 / IMI 039719) TaxID=759272 RepID=G0SB23_CHATD|nr:hypothetical protein CTHT_0048620 [Thermochaetoides thermophila DSM 1495]EGS19403.1 hypothetical protein CTHT_0048620 [Thermochaetoides thermophila DSM 1495]